MKSPREKYQRRVDKYNEMLKRQNKTVNLISNLRLIDAVAAIASFIYFYRTKNYAIAWGTAGGYSLIFIYLIMLHNRAIEYRRYFTYLLDINETSLKRFTDEWKSFKDTGEEFRDDEHPYSQDLDIFGRASLFQWINTGKTNLGRLSLKKALTELAVGAEEIKTKQEALSELSKKLWWRQRFEAEATFTSSKAVKVEELLRWADEKAGFYSRPMIKLIIRVMPAITIGALVLSYGAGMIPRVVFNLLALIQLGLIFYPDKRKNSALQTVYQHKENIKVYSRMLRQLEKTSFRAKHLKSLKEGLFNTRKESVTRQIRQLEKIVERISNRGNMAFFIINVLLLWDYQCIIALEKWREESGTFIRKWIETIGEMEALSSLAVIGHDNPDWAIPHVTEEPSVFKARAMGHPLLSGKQVSNDLFIEKPAKALLITGSNMSGKSTLLRTSGINLVLAYSGAPVCATFMECSIMTIHTCMRVSDNLEKNISSFYAELLRISDIVKASKFERQVFFLLDEIFKGTNSQDRHQGAKIVIKNLCENGAMGMVSTHDLELGEMEREAGGEVKNYHFLEHYKDNKIYFDYKLRPGVSTTRNAMYLIRMVGIEGEEE